MAWLGHGRGHLDSRAPHKRGERNDEEGRRANHPNDENPGIFGTFCGGHEVPCSFDRVASPAPRPLRFRTSLDVFS